jgi:methionyl-tRNA formyltransferase
VTALIKGGREIGVTAFSPTAAVDEGPMFAQRSVALSYPIKIEAALRLQTDLMTEIAVEIVEKWRAGILQAKNQQKTNATYSIWRDDADYEIDWSNSADQIERFVNSVGYPYSGARTTVGGIDAIRVLDVTVVPDLCFEIRDQTLERSGV